MNSPTAKADNMAGAAETNFDSLFAEINNELALVKDRIESQSRIDIPLLEPFAEFLKSQNGKMIRPGLVLLSGKTVGTITDVHIRVASIIEMLHNATLLHDDVLDESQCRRSETSANKLWGNEPAVLLGDLLLSNVLAECSKLNQPRIVAILAEATKKMCLGEMLQHIQRKNFELTEAEYIDIIAGKTAVLFSLCCQSGALASDADDETSEALAMFGLNLGIAFQINDDLLDITGDEAEAGKSLGKDLDKNILTLPVIHLLKTADDEQRFELIDRLKNKSVGTDELAKLMQNSSSFAYTKGQTENYCQKAIDALEPLKETTTKTALMKLARFLFF